jgi:magnesium chelatase family protein
VANGLPVFTIVGPADTGVRESRERVRAAILSSCFEFPNRRIFCCQPGARRPPQGIRALRPGHCVGILAAGGQIPSKGLDEFEFAAELSLSGKLRPVHGRGSGRSGRSGPR